mmetsp:Transcript_118650/g.335587  ORF Transcript_118650/g.335587 Transcript_118650/m.335587 type:complete len:195 (+) Transcript_118650:128-712(+)
MGGCFSRWFGSGGRGSGERAHEYEKCKDTLERLSSERKGRPGVAYEASSCAICLEDFPATGGAELKTLECAHKFHRECIDRWEDQSSQCPLCRHQSSSARAGRAACNEHMMPDSELDFRANRAMLLYPDFITMAMVLAWTSPSFQGDFAADSDFVAGEGLDMDGAHEGFSIFDGNFFDGGLGDGFAGAFDGFGD